MRAIDGDALKRKAQKVATEAWKMKLTAKIETTLNQFIDWIDTQPTVHSEPHWIPVEQALPQIGEYVLCETTTRYFGKYHVCKFVDKDKWVDKPHFDWDRHGFPHVVAWTRFEPYKGMTE